MRGIGRGAAIACFALALAAPVQEARCDSVTLKDGTELECRVVGYDAGLFVISSADIVTNLPAASVNKISFSAGPDGRGQSRRGDRAEPGKQLEVNELEWVKTAVAQPKANDISPRAILANRVDLAGRLVKIEVQARSDIEQVTADIYAVRFWDGSADVRAVFTKDALEYMQKIPGGRMHGRQKSFDLYAVVMSDRMKRDLLDDIWRAGDILLIGRTAKKEAGGKTAYSW